MLWLPPNRLPAMANRAPWERLSVALSWVKATWASQMALWPFCCWCPCPCPCSSTSPFRLCCKDSEAVGPDLFSFCPPHPSVLLLYCPLYLENSSDEEFCRGPRKPISWKPLGVLLPLGFGYMCPSSMLSFLCPLLNMLYYRHLSLYLSLHRSVSSLRGRFCVTFLSADSALSTASSIVFWVNS